MNRVEAKQNELKEIWVHKVLLLVLTLMPLCALSQLVPMFLMKDNKPMLFIGNAQHAFYIQIPDDFSDGLGQLSPDIADLQKAERIENDAQTFRAFAYPFAVVQHIELGTGLGESSLDTYVVKNLETGDEWSFKVDHFQRMNTFRVSSDGQSMAFMRINVSDQTEFVVMKKNGEQRIFTEEQLLSSQAPQPESIPEPNESPDFTRFVFDFSPDGKNLIVSPIHSDGFSELLAKPFFEIDTETGASKFLGRFPFSGDGSTINWIDEKSVLFSARHGANKSGPYVSTTEVLDLETLQIAEREDFPGFLQTYHVNAQKDKVALVFATQSYTFSIITLDLSSKEIIQRHDLKGMIDHAIWLDDTHLNLLFQPFKGSSSANPPPMIEAVILDLTTGKYVSREFIHGVNLFSPTEVVQTDDVTIIVGSDTFGNVEVIPEE